MSVIRKSYTVEFKTKVVREILREEKTLSQIASKYGIHTNIALCGVSCASFSLANRLEVWNLYQCHFSLARSSAGSSARSIQ